MLGTGGSPRRPPGAVPYGGVRHSECPPQPARRVSRVAFNRHKWAAITTGCIPRAVLRLLRCQAPGVIGVFTSLFTLRGVLFFCDAMLSGWLFAVCHAGRTPTDQILYCSPTGGTRAKAWGERSPRSTTFLHALQQNGAADSPLSLG